MKILIFDIETSPNLGWVWGKWEQNVVSFKENWYIMSFAYKWLDESKTYVKSLPDYPIYKKSKTDDKELVSDLWDLFDEADVIIAHNGDQFDVKKANTRFLMHGFAAPSSYKTIDTKKVAKKYFRFDSNKLDDLGEYLQLGRKIDTGGFDLWLECMAGNMKAWKKMCKYNVQDVILLEKVYLELRNWMTNHPNSNVFDNTEGSCPTCGSTNVQKRGHGVTTISKYQRYQCQDCGSWSRGKIEKTNVELR